MAHVLVKKKLPKSCQACHYFCGTVGYKKCLAKSAEGMAIKMDFPTWKDRAPCCPYKYVPDDSFINVHDLAKWIKEHSEFTDDFGHIVDTEALMDHLTEMPKLFSK